MWADATTKLAKIGVNITNPEPINRGAWGEVFTAFYAPEHMYVVVKITRDLGEVKVINGIVDMVNRGFILSGFPTYVHPPIGLGNRWPPGAVAIVREAVEPFTDAEQLKLAPQFEHIFLTLDDEANLYIRSHGRGRAKHREAYIAVTRTLDSEFPQIAASLRFLATEAKLLVSDVGVHNIARARERYVLYDFHVY